MALRSHSLYYFTIAILICAGSRPASADVVINISEFGGNVVAILSGELNLDATLGAPGGASGAEVFWPADGYISVGSLGVDPPTLYEIDTQIPSYGPGTFGVWDSTSGDFFGFRLFEQPFLNVPQGYVSGTSLSGSSTEFGTDLATLGFAPGEYVSTITGAGGITDTITVRIGAAIPEPAAVSVLMAMAMGATLIRRRTCS